MKTFIFPFLACCFLAFNALASKGVEIRHKTQFCAAEVYFRYPDRNPPQEEIDKSNRERTTVTLREYITLTATLDGKKLPKGTRCDWSAVEGGEYFKLDSIDNKPDQVIVNINTLAKARQTLKVKAEVDGVEQVSNDDSFDMARKAARVEGIPVGISSGAALTAAFRLAAREENAGKTIVVIIPSFAERYLSTALFEGL